MIKKSKPVLFSTFLLLLFLIQVPSVFAYATFSGHKLTNGVHNRYTWIDTTTMDVNVYNNITFAKNDWNNTPTHVWFIETSNKPYSVMDFYRGNYYAASQGVLGITHMYVGNSEVVPTNQDWGWTRIYLNAPSFDQLSTYYYAGSGYGYINQKKSVIAHEMGHVFGLAHVGSSTVLMYPYGNTCKVDHATQDEINGVNALYP